MPKTNLFLTGLASAILIAFTPFSSAQEEPLAEETPAVAETETLGEVAAAETTTGAGTAIEPETGQPEEVTTTTVVTDTVELAVPGEDAAEVAEQTASAMGEEAPVISEEAGFIAEDIIPLPEGVDMMEDAALMDLPADQGLLEDTGVMFPSDIPPALDAGFDVPDGAMGEPARVSMARYKALRIKIDKDPEVVSLAQQAEEARRDEDKRQARRAYYRLLFAKMRKADPTLSAKCDLMERAYLQRLEQTRVEPTIPLSPPPTPEPLR